LADRTGHYFPITHLKCKQCTVLNDVRVVVGPLFNNERVRATGQKPVLVIVCASGGGAPAAAWTAKVLTGLQQEMGPEFIRSIRLISSVSGGALGSLYYVASYSRD